MIILVIIEIKDDKGTFIVMIFRIIYIIIDNPITSNSIIKAYNGGR